eukprot:5537988-Amphidinium_carterae.1
MPSLLSTCDPPFSRALALKCTWDCHLSLGKVSISIPRHRLPFNLIYGNFMLASVSSKLVFHNVSTSSFVMKRLCHSPWAPAWCGGRRAFDTRCQHSPGHHQEMVPRIGPRCIARCGGELVAGRG